MLSFFHACQNCRTITLIFLNALKCNMKWWHGLNITMLSPVAVNLYLYFKFVCFVCPFHALVWGIWAYKNLSGVWRWDKHNPSMVFSGDRKIPPFQRPKSLHLDTTGCGDISMWQDIIVQMSCKQRFSTKGIERYNNEWHQCWQNSLILVIEWNSNADPNGNFQQLKSK